MRVARLDPSFIEQRPDVLEQGILYISITFRTSVHLCCCGCSNEVWLPIRPSRWHFTYDGENISISRSIGNWSFACQSHYWIRDGDVHWSAPWTSTQIEAGRDRTRANDLAVGALEEQPQPPAHWRRVTRRAAVARRLPRLGRRHRSGHGD